MSLESTLLVLSKPSSGDDGWAEERILLNWKKNWLWLGRGVSGIIERHT
jgi:hypothetical protein